MFSGVCTALVTPFDSFKKVDYKALKKLLNFQIENGVKNILILGTTGESSTINFLERENIIKFVKSNLTKDVKLIVGTGSNNLQTALKQTKQAKSLGADVCLVVTPYYNKCSNDGLVKYYSEINKLDIPFLVYNVPSRTGVNIQPEFMLKLVKLKNMVGLKEANSNIEHILKMFYFVKDKTNIYCGNDNLNYVFNSLGAKGTISVLSNIFPKQMVKCYKENNFDELNKYYNITNLLFIEPNPICVKYVLSKLGLIQNSLRMPLTRLTLKNKNLVNKELKNIL